MMLAMSPKSSAQRIRFYKHTDGILNHGALTCCRPSKTEGQRPKVLQHEKGN